MCVCVCVCVCVILTWSLPSPGAFFWLLFLPAWVLFLVLQVNLEDPSLTNFPPPLPPLDAFWDPRALGFVVLWILFQVLLYLLPVGKVSERRRGLKKPSGRFTNSYIEQYSSLYNTT